MGTRGQKRLRDYLIAEEGELDLELDGAVDTDFANGSGISKFHYAINSNKMFI